VADRAGLENRSAGNRTVGSNPTLSARNRSSRSFNSLSSHETWANVGSRVLPKWNDKDVRSSGEAVEHFRHPTLGSLGFDCSACAVDGRTDLSSVVCNRVTPSVDKPQPWPLKHNARAQAARLATGRAAQWLCGSPGGDAPKAAVQIAKATHDTTAVYAE
jgi:hypothetical protein